MRIPRPLRAISTATASNPPPAPSGPTASRRARGRSLLEVAKEADADLLVMGAYGEGKITAMLGLGRATEKVVMSCKVPLLVQA